MMTSRLLVPAVLLLWTLLPNTCVAWGGEGHQLIALIAEDQLTPAAKAAVGDLLPGAHISDAEIANWADEIRRERRETARWHYVNIPYDASEFDRKRDGHNGDNVIDALERQTTVLADKSASPEQRQEALKWVVHLVGDLHQPLHCADRDGDKGGNSRLVFYPGQRSAKSLHEVWDTWLLRDVIGRRRIVDVANSIEKTISPTQRMEWRTGNTEQWANESHAVAVTLAYDDVPTGGPPPRLDLRYIDPGRAAVLLQIKRAGIRLAAILNGTLK